MSPPSPLVAALLSAVVPGLGQLANGERAKGWGVLASTVGVFSGCALALWGPSVLRSWTTVVLLVAVYPFLWWPAVADAYRASSGSGSALLGGERIWYVLVMLATIGPMALPMLWQSPRFSHRWKVALSVGVVAIALAAIAFAVWLGPLLEQQLGEALELLAPP